MVSQTYGSNIPKEKIGTPLIRLYGITETKVSVCLIIENFFPYFYIKKPKNFVSSDIKTLSEAIDKILRSKKQSYYLKHLEILDKIDIYNYNPQKMFQL